MSILNVLESKYVIAPAALVATVTMLFVIRRLSESPERKIARQLLGQIDQARLDIIYTQEDHEGYQPAYKQANQLLDQALEPGKQAEIAFKEKRYLDAQRHAGEALRLLEVAQKAQCPEQHFPTIIVFSLYFRPSSSERFGSN